MLKEPDPDLQYLLWLTEVAALSPVKGVKLLETFGSAKAVWQARAEQLEKCVKLEAGEKHRLQNRSLALPNPGPLRPAEYSDPHHYPAGISRPAAQYL